MGLWLRHGVVAESVSSEYCTKGMLINGKCIRLFTGKRKGINYLKCATNSASPFILSLQG